MVYWPELAVTRRGAAYVAGMDLRTFGDEPMPETPLTVWELGGGGLGRPSGRFRFAYPHLLVDERDGLHLVWGEPAGGAVPVTTVSWITEEKVVSLWTAAYAPGHGWSTPRKLFEDPALELLWHNMLAPPDGDPTRGPWLLAVAGKARVQGPSSEVLVGFDGDSLVTTTIPRATDAIHSRAVYSSVASVKQKVYAGFIASLLTDPTTHREQGAGSTGPKKHTFDVNSVFLRYSPDAGATWHPPVVVSRSGGHGAYELNTVVTPDGALHLLWLQDRPEVGTVVRHVVSTDDGATWSAPDDLRLPHQGMTQALRVVADGCGTLYLVYHQLDGTTGRERIYHATRRAGWTEPEHLFPSHQAGLPTIRLRPDGGLLLAFIARPIDGPRDAPFMPMFAELPAR